MVSLLVGIGLGIGIGGEVDSDRDGISDFHELHKHFTDPKLADSDGDGVADGDWEERREYAYTVRTIVHVLEPVTRDVLCDDYQDARLLEEHPDFVELEVVHYPLNTVASAIVADPDWRRHVAGRADLQPYLAPGTTSNWDATMRDELIAALAADGIDVAKLDDRTLVERASKWLLDSTQFQDGFTTYCATFEDGRARVLPGLEGAVERNKNEKGLTVEAQWDRELFAAGMWKHRMHGSCTSSAIFLTGCLRALGVPTRIVLAMPLVDGSDDREVAWLATRLTHHRVRKLVRDAIEPLGDTWANHTFNEVFVGGRWRRLNYSKLGQDILDPNCFGMMTHVATFADWSDGEMAKTWGSRQNRPGREKDVFGGSNPYSCISLSDRIGAHAKVDNPAPPEHRTLTISRLYWLQSPECRVEVSLRGRDPATLFFAHVDECFRGEGLGQYRDFDDGVDRQFVLEAEGVPDLRVEAASGYWLDEDAGIHEFLLQLAPDQLALMEKDVPYRLEPRNRRDPYRWAVAPGVALVRSGPSPSKDTSPKKTEPKTEPSTGLAFALDTLAWSDDPDLPTFVREHLVDEPRILARVDEWKEWSAIKELTVHGDTRFFLEADARPTLEIDLRTGGYTWREETGIVAWVALELDAGDWRDLARNVDYKLRPRNSTPGFQWIVADGITIARSPEAEPGDVVLTIDSTLWSDSAESPDWIREELVDQPVLLGHVANWDGDFEAIRSFTENCDRRFLLEAEGRPTLTVVAGTGGASERNDKQVTAWVCLHLDSAEWSALDHEASYTLRPQNDAEGWRWIVKDSAKTPPRR